MVPRAAAPLSFVVHKHAARRLHYDFRLEHDGVLLSWAIPKGPSLDPGEKRLAVRVEDHPLDYGNFEGVLPEGEYGAGAVLIWDRGTWEPEPEVPPEGRADKIMPEVPPEGRADKIMNPRAALRAGKLVFRLRGEKLRGGFALVRMKPRAARGGRETWLLIKARDEDAARAGAREVVEARPRSVVTGRRIEEVARGAAAKTARAGKGGGRTR